MINCGKIYMTEIKRLNLAYPNKYSMVELIFLFPKWYKYLNDESSPVQDELPWITFSGIKFLKKILVMRQSKPNLPEHKPQPFEIRLCKRFRCSSQKNPKNLQKNLENRLSFIMCLTINTVQHKTNFTLRHLKYNKRAKSE